LRGYQLDRLRNAAKHLVSAAWARDRIEGLADALLEQGILDADAI
jgi:hypothetical protein